MFTFLHSYQRLAASIAAVLISAQLPLRADALPESYKVIWDSPSPDSLDSMPLSGRRGAGANVWVQDGSIWLYLAHGAAFDEGGRLMKLGCVRLTPSGVQLGGSLSLIHI